MTDKIDTGVTAPEGHELCYMTIERLINELADVAIFKSRLYDLASEWETFPNEAAPPYKPLDAHRCAIELRQRIRGQA